MALMINGDFPNTQNVDLWVRIALLLAKFLTAVGSVRPPGLVETSGLNLVMQDCPQNLIEVDCS